MDKKTKPYGWMLRLMSVAFLLAGLTACDSSEESDNEPDKPKPDVPVAEGDWQTVSTAGGTIEKDDLTLQFAASTFTNDVKVAVSEANASVASEDARSKFYQITLPESGTTKPFTVRLKCNGSTDNVRPVVKTIAWNKHTGKTTFVVFDIDATVSNGEVVATIPILASDGSENPYFTIGLAECPSEEEDVQTRATTFNYQYRVGVPLNEYNKNKASYLEIRALIKKTLPEVSDLLKSLNFNIKSTVIYRLVSSTDNEDVKNCWGIFKPAWYGKEWSMVSLNRDYFMNYVNNPTPDMLNQLKATLIHETLHSVTTNDYDPRWGWTICKAGEKGDDWAQFDEGLGCWVEKVIGDKKLSENTVKWQNCFIYEFYPHVRDQEPCKNCGYGMGTFIEFLARKTSDQSIVTIFEAFKNGNSDFRAVLKKFLSDNNIQFFTTKDYYDFAFSVMNNTFDSEIDADDTVTPDEKGLPTTDKMTDREFSYKRDVYNYGVLVNRLYFTASKLKEFKDSAIIVTQNKEDVLTRVYYGKGKKLEFIGQCMKGDTVSITVEDFSNKSGINLSAAQPTGSARLYIATTRVTNKDDYSSLPSDVKVEFHDVGFTPRTDIEKLKIHYTIYCDHTDYSTTSKDYMQDSWTFDGDELKVTKTANTIKITAENAVEKGHQAGTNVVRSLSMTIKYNSLGYLEISDLNLDVEWTGIVHTKTALKASNIKSDATYQMGAYKYYWYSTVETGLNLSDYSFVYIERPTSYILDKGNTKSYIDVTIDFNH